MRPTRCELPPLLGVTLQPLRPSGLGTAVPDAAFVAPKMRALAHAFRWSMASAAVAEAAAEEEEAVGAEGARS